MNIEPDKDVLELADELEALSMGRLTPEAFEERYRAKYESGRVPHATLDLISSVHHFLSDGDIRARDADYRRMQEREMCRLIDCLRSGKLDAPARISFLRETEDPQ